jgi:hypothetical protein
MHPTMRRRAAQLLLWALPIVAPAQGPARAWAADPSPKPNRPAQVHYEIKVGMTVEEVEAVLGPGRPITVAQFGEARTAVQARIKEKIAAGARALQWQDGRKRIVVVFDHDRKVTSATAQSLGD